MITPKNKLDTTLLYQEIHQQPDVMARFIEGATEQIETLATAIRTQDIHHVVIAARGTSDNAGRYAQYVLGAFNGLPVSLTTPSLFTIFKRPTTFKHALVMGISQSGQSPDIVAVLEEAQRQGVLTAAITNMPDSPLAGASDVVIPLCAGEEKAVAATKTYTTELAAIAMLSAALSQDAARRLEIEQMPVAMRATLGMNDVIAAVAPRYRYMQRCVVIGRGFNYATAFEMALKMKELTYTIVEPYSSADFLHGPLAMLEPGFPVILIAPSGVMAKNMLTFTQQARAHQAEVVVLSDVDELLEAGRVRLRIPVSVPEWLSPLTAIMPGQLFAMQLAHTRDYDIDSPRGIRKVTETR